MNHDKFFWLHIKKSAGITTRTLLQPYYVEVDRVKKPKSFIQASPEEYNDILNNYRIPLGEYQFRRCLFAKQYLYPDRWDNILSFAFSREPTERCVSMFFYLYWQVGSLEKRVKRVIRRYIDTGKFHYSTSYAFDVFLDYVQEARTSDSIYIPFDSSFTTHTAPMWEDVTDLDGNILLKRIFRLENLVDGINQVFEECGLEKRIEANNDRFNVNTNKVDYTPTKAQIHKIETIYNHDFEIYEEAGH